ncbi:30S ribosomal protein S6e [Candidatus Woesearchaeota archaeon]|nr:30S ribosomal protein S6e [Candidatus Woesearchaeota archaeon]MBT7237487.1 30S ribosomal protein S6e [Candidatus Woesearchaeota archaeon]
MFVINDPKTGKSYKKEGDAQIYMGKKVRDKIDGNAIGLKGYELEITGGSDAQGFPMRGDLDTMGRKRPLVVSGVGAKLKEKGIKQRKTVHGKTVDETINQLNVKIVKVGSEDLEKALGLVKEEVKTEDAPAAEEVPKEEPKVEEKKE